MARSTQFNSRTYDWVTISLYVGLVLIGWLMLYASVYVEGQEISFFDIGGTIGSQSIWIAISFVVFWLIVNVDWKIWQGLAYPIYGIAILMLIAVLLFGVEIKGAQSWFRIGGFSFQPSEFAKLSTCLALAAYLSYFKCDIKQRKSQLIIFAFIAVPMILILLQPDAGSASIFLAFGILLYREGLHPNYYYVGISLFLVFVLTIMYNPILVISVFCFVIAAIYISQLFHKQNAIFIFLGLLLLNVIAIFWPVEAAALKYLPQLSKLHLSYTIMGINVLVLAIASVFMWQKRFRQVVTVLLPSLMLLSAISYGTNYFFKSILKPHQQDRINVWLKPSECDPRKSLYNIIQSKTAIGSGGVFGKGYLEGTMTELNHVPEQTTDFIFSIVGEEQGFIGVLSIILLFGFLVYRIFVIGERARELFVRRYAYGLGGILFIHFFINIGMTMGICPVIGIPLPFLSKGGTALFFFSVMLAILVRMDYDRLK